MKGRQLLLLEMEELELMLLLRQSRQQKADKVPKITKFFPETLPPAVCATLKILLDATACCADMFAPGRVGN